MVERILPDSFYHWWCDYCQWN